MICSVLDTSTVLQQYQPTSNNAKYLIDVLYDNRSIELDLPFVCISETIQQFYDAHRKSQETSTAMTIQERTFLINRLKQDINNGRLIPYPTTESLFARTEQIFNVSFTIPPKGRDPIDIPDMLVISTALELKSLTDLVKEVYIFSSDWHLNDTAIALGIQSFNPKTITVDLLPDCFNRRKFKRETIGLKVTCHNCQTSLPLGPTQTINVGEYGLCIEHPKGKINEADRLNLRVSHRSDLGNITERNGMVMWSKDNRAGIELEEPIEVSSLG